MTDDAIWGRRLRTTLMVTVAALFCSGCQFLQNEFFFLDTARPAPPPPEESGERPW